MLLKFWSRGQDLLLRLDRYCSAFAERGLATEACSRGFADAKHAPSFQIHSAICHRHIAFVPSSQRVNKNLYSYFFESRGQDLNPRPADYKSAALPTELPRH